jgi:hypothetical protein
MSGADYTTTPNLGLYKPNYALDVGKWGDHLNFNSDKIDATIGTALHAVNYGVIPDAPDNTDALQAFFAALQAFPSGVKGVLPSGVLRFTTPIALSGKQLFSLVGSGVGVTSLYYIGVSPTVDLLRIFRCANFSLAGFAIDSQTPMTGGSGLHLEECGSCWMDGIKVAGQSGSTHIGPDGNMHFNLWNGVWFDKTGIATLMNFELAAQNDASRINGSIGSTSGNKAGVYMSFGKILSSGTGVHVGGAFGGFFIDAVDVIANWNNLVIDQALSAEFNREIFIGDHASFDSSGGLGTPTSPGPVNPGGGAIGDNVTVNDPGGGFLVIRGWVVSTFHGGNCIHIKGWAGPIRIDGCLIAYANGGMDGIRIDDPTPTVIVTNGTALHGISGWGINQTVPMKPVLGAPTFTDAGLGDISPTTRLQLNVKDIGVSFNAGVTATGTTQATAAPLSASSSVVGTVTAGSGVLLPVPTIPGTRHDVINTAATALNVYPPIGWSVFGDAPNAPRVLPQRYRLSVIANPAGSQWMIEYSGPMMVP